MPDIRAVKPIPGAQAGLSDDEAGCDQPPAYYEIVL